MTEFWERAFQDKQEMWGLEPTNSAIAAADLFDKEGVKKVLIPGIGYGRNAQAFLDKGMEVTGIEISKTAIELAEARYGRSLKIHHGGVSDMPFDHQAYDGVFCHALIHLLDEDERAKLIADCYNQLSENGRMFFTAITKNAETYGQGTFISKDRYEQFGGVNLFFFDENSLQLAFATHGLYQVDTFIDNYPFYLIQCGK